MPICTMEITKPIAVSKKKKKKNEKRGHLNAPGKNCSVQHRLVESLEAIPELDGEIAQKILVGLALAFQQNIYLLLQKIEVLGGSNSSCCPCDHPRLSGFRK